MSAPSHIKSEETGADAGNRGRSASVDKDGAVKGSGASAGGGGAGEDIAADPAGGSGRNVQPRATDAKDAASKDGEG